MSRSRVDNPVARAFLLGWRICDIYAVGRGKFRDPEEDRRVGLVGTPEQIAELPTSPGVSSLPSHGSLPPSEWLQLQFGAAVADAGELNVALDANSLVELSTQAADTPDWRQAFHEANRQLHLRLEVSLWREADILGEAYELGFALSDTWQYVARFYDLDDEGPARAAKRSSVWRVVFSDHRVRRLLSLLGDLQHHLDPHAVSLVIRQLGAWSRAATAVSNFDPPPRREAELLLRQTLVWRQLLSGARAPEDFLRQRPLKSLLRLYRRGLIVTFLAAAAFAVAVIALWDGVANFYSDHTGLASVASAVLAVGVAFFGVSRPALLTVIKQPLQALSDWSWRYLVGEAVFRDTTYAHSLRTAMRRREQLAKHQTEGRRSVEELDRDPLPAESARSRE